MAWSWLRGQRPSQRRNRKIVNLPEALECRTLLSATGVGTFNNFTGLWALNSVAAAGVADAGTFQFGESGPSKVPVVGDWNGDGKDDIGTFDRNTTTWTLRDSTNTGGPDTVFKFGTPGSIPVVGDWNGDGTDDIGVFDPSNQTWSLHIGASSGPASSTFQFGTANTLPVVGDWNGDHHDGIGVFDPISNTWSLRQTATGGNADLQFQFGQAGAETPVVGDWNGDGTDGVGIYQPDTGDWLLRQTATTGSPDAGVFQFGGTGTVAVVGNFQSLPTPNPDAGNQLLTLTLKPLDLDLLGLHIQSSPITASVTTHEGDGKLLGNLLSNVSGLVDVSQINTALNNVLGTTVDLLNSIGLEVDGIGTGTFTTAPVSTTPLLNLAVAPVHLDLLGVQVDTSPITLSISAEAGDGLVLGNVLTSLTDLFNPPLPDHLDLAFVNSQLTQLLSQLDSQIPGIPAATVPPPVLQDHQILDLTVPAINLDLAGLVLKTTPITVNASAQTGDGLLLGNILSVALNTVGATPQQTSDLNANVDNLLAKVIGVLNVSTITLPTNALSTLSGAIHTLALPDLTTATPGASTTILNLVVASSDGVTPPVSVDLLGVHIQTSDINAQLLAETGDGKILGNLLYNVSNLLNPGGPAGLISLITDLATGSNVAGTLGAATSSPGAVTSPATQILTVTVPPLDLDLLGLQVQSSPITVTISAQEGNGQLLGNALTGISTLINTNGLSQALNNVLSSTINLLNSSELNVSGVLDGTFSSATESTTQILQVQVAPVHLDLLGVIVDTGPITLTVNAHAGNGQVLGNVLTSLTDLFNPPLPSTLDLAFINTRLDQLLSDLNAQLPGIPSAVIPPTTWKDGQILGLTVPAIDLNLLGLMLNTSPITVTATAQTGNGLLLGNLLTEVLNTLDATPAELRDLSAKLDRLLAKVIGVLNASSLTVSSGAVSALTPVLQTLSLPTLISGTPNASTELLNLIIDSADGTTPPVMVDLMGVHVETSNIDAQLSAQTGDGQVLGNLLYNVANLLNPDSPTALLFLLAQLGH
ncbi:MAG: hypothetical protein JWM11_323 [Planctomycetaceae bacterium]|nr:hypothetical protein [Planctomycetaceae bacterium]